MLSKKERRLAIILLVLAPFVGAGLAVADTVIDEYRYEQALNKWLQ